MTSESEKESQSGEDDDRFRSPQICISGEDQPVYTIGTTPPEKELFEEMIEEYGFRSKSEAARAFLTLGMNVMLDADPREHGTSYSNSSDYDPVTIRELIPQGSENAVDVRDELIDIIDGKLPEVVQEDPEITQEGWEVYR